MGWMSRLNRDALDYYLRGEGGELARREAQQELYRRGQASISEQEMIEILRQKGYVVFHESDDNGIACPYCGVGYMP